jgi:hypothetical protein
MAERGEDVGYFFFVLRGNKGVVLEVSKAGGGGSK